MLGHRHPRRDGWRVLVQGRIVRDAELTLGKRLLLKGLQRALRNTGESVTSQLFFDRVEGFLAAPEQRRRVYVDIDGTSYRLRRKSKSSGLFVGKLDLPEGVFGNLMSRANRGYATASVQVHIVGENSTTAVGEIFLASPSGISVVSDIDDTIKRTCVTSRREMLAQTFLRPFEAIDGMAHVYQHWQQQGALFHYVSSSPWQIFQPLQKFLDEHHFPSGSMHLRWFRLRDEMFKRWRLLRRKSKGGTIVGMMSRLPQRRFVLIGDSGERDPEIYAKIAQKLPHQVAMVAIRDLEERPMDHRRHLRILRKMGTVPLFKFQQADQIRDLLQHL